MSIQKVPLAILPDFARLELFRLAERMSKQGQLVIIDAMFDERSPWHGWKIEAHPIGNHAGSYWFPDEWTEFVRQGMPTTECATCIHTPALYDFVWQGQTLRICRHCLDDVNGVERQAPAIPVLCVSCSRPRLDIHADGRCIRCHFTQ